MQFKTCCQQEESSKRNLTWVSIDDIPVTAVPSGAAFLFLFFGQKSIKNPQNTGIFHKNTYLKSIA